MAAALVYLLSTANKYFSIRWYYNYFEKISTIVLVLFIMGFGQAPTILSQEAA